MTLPSSGQISLNAIALEFGKTSGANGIESFYSGGSYVSAGKANGTGHLIPSSGVIEFSDFYGASGFTPVTHTYTSPTTNATETIPAGATTVVIECWGAGSSGAPHTGTGCSIATGAGGASGGYSRTSISVSGHSGQTILYTVGTGGAPSASAGGLSNVHSGTFTVTTMTDNGGGAPTTGLSGVGGTGGTASGGSAVNTNGNSGGNWGDGHAGAAIVGLSSAAYGAGGHGGTGGGGTAGGNGGIKFEYT